MLTGKNGQVGWELNRSLLPLGEIIALDRSGADFSKPQDLRSLVREVKPDVIVNAAAYTAVDKAESEEDLATTINAVSPGVLAEEARALDALFVHYSTDYVFDGTKEQPYSEDDTPNPINVYGQSKLAGEQAVQKSGANYIIFRTSWVYGARGQNFLQTILRLAQERDELRIVADQIGSPTWARFIAETTAHCIRQSIGEMHLGTFTSGIFHLTSEGKASWCEFAQAIIDRLCDHSESSVKVNGIEPIRTVDYITPAERPMNSCLATIKLQEHFKLKLPKWECALDLCMEEI